MRRQNSLLVAIAGRVENADRVEAGRVENADRVEIVDRVDLVAIVGLVGLAEFWAKSC